jgi:alkyl hydroperoxide reductase subunit AhpC
VEGDREAGSPERRPIDFSEKYQAVTEGLLEPLSGEHPLSDIIGVRRTLQGATPVFESHSEEAAMSLRINSEAPNFTADTTQGPITFHDWIGDGWAILFSHPKDFTPVCTTELGYMAGLKPEFDKRNCKVIGLSVDPVDNHKRWSKDIEETQGHAVTYPMIGDPELKVAKSYDMLPESAGTTSEGRTAADNATVRSVFLIGPDKKVKAMLTYPMSTGRNFDEVLRLLDSCQLTAKHKVATPVNWKQGQDVIIVPAVSDDDAKKAYPGGWKAPKPYLRIVPQPK